MRYSFVDLIEIILAFKICYSVSIVSIVTIKVPDKANRFEKLTKSSLLFSHHSYFLTVHK